MKTHTSGFKENVKLFGRELDSKITYELDGVTVELGNEELNSITPHYEGAILKSVMKQLDIDSNVEIPVGTILTYEFGVKVGNGYEYINYGNYVVYSVEKQEDTRSYKIVAYDKMLYAMKDYENSNITYPITIKNYLIAICNKLGLTYEGSQFANSDKVIENELYLDTDGNSLGYTFRDVLDELAEVSGGTICINNNDELEVRYIKDVGELQTLTGSSIEITDGEEAELSSFELEGKTTQETRSGKNLFKYPYLETTKTLNGITFTDMGDGSIKINGTATAQTIFYIKGGVWRYDANEIIEQGDYTISLKSYDADIYLCLNLYDENNQSFFYRTYGNDGTTFNVNVSKSLSNPRIVINNGKVINNLIVYPQLEKGTQATEWEPYGAMPSPDYPSPLVSVGYENLFNDTIRQGVTSYDTGVFLNNNARLTSTDWTILPAGTYTINAKTTTEKELYISNVTFDTNGNFYNISGISGQWIQFPMTFTTPIDIKWKCNIRFGDYSNIIPSQVVEIQLTKGIQFHSYIPYGKYGIEVKTTGKNLLDYNNLTTQATNVGIAINTNNELYDTSPTGDNRSWNYTNSNWKFNLGSGTYTINLIFSTKCTNTGSGLIVYDSSNNAIIGGSNTFTNLDNKSYTFTLTENKNIGIMIKIYDGIAKIQLEKGNQATEYEPYQSNTQLYQLDNPLRAIGDYKDELYIENGMLYVDRKIGSIVLDGTQSISLQSINSYNIANFLITFANEYYDTTNYANMLSDYFTKQTTGISTTKTEGFLPTLNSNTHILGVYLRVNSSRASSTTSMNSWLSNNNVEVNYVLNEPYTEALGQVNIPSTYEGITYIDTTDDLESTMKVTYISEFDEIDEEYLKDVNVNFGEKFGAVNTIILSRSGDSDKIAQSLPSDLADEDKVAIQISDNQIMNGNDRDEYIPAILNKLYGLEYYINDFSSTGICYYDLCDRYRVKIGDTSYKCIMFNDEVNVTQGLQEFIHTDMQEENETEYKYTSTTDQKIKQAFIIVNKQQGEIEAKVSQDDIIASLNLAIEDEQGIVRLTGNQVIIDSDYFKLNADGTIQSTGGTIGGYKISDNMLYAEVFSPYNFTSTDISKVANYINGTGTLTTDELEKYDINKDGVVDAIDLGLIQNFVFFNITSSKSAKIKMQTGNGVFDTAYVLEDGDGNEIAKISFYGIYFQGKNLSTINSYSIGEINTGNWIDGKPIYRKVYQTTTVAGSNNISISNISSDIDTITKLDGTCIQPSGNITPLSYYNGSNDYVNLYYSANDSVIRIRCGSAYGFGDTRLVVEYTKTTD